MLMSQNRKTRKFTVLSKPTRPHRLLKCVTQPKKFWAVCGGRQAEVPAPAVSAPKLATTRPLVAKNTSSPILVAFAHTQIQTPWVCIPNQSLSFNCLKMNFMVKAHHHQNQISQKRKFMVLCTIDSIQILQHQTSQDLTWSVPFLPKKKEWRLMRRAKMLSTVSVTNC